MELCVLLTTRDKHPDITATSSTEVYNGELYGGLYVFGHIWDSCIVSS